MTRYKLGHEDTIEMVCIEDHGTLFDIDHTVPEAPYVLLSEDTLQSRNVEDDARLGTSRCSHLIVGPGRVQLESHPSVVGSCCIVCNFLHLDRVAEVEEEARVQRERRTDPSKNALGALYPCVTLGIVDDVTGCAQRPRRCFLACTRGTQADGGDAPPGDCDMISYGHQCSKKVGGRLSVCRRRVRILCTSSSPTE